MRLFRDALVVAGFDLWESLRSRKALVLLVLYMAGAMASAGIFVAVLQEVEKTVAETVSVATTERPGAMTESLMQSDELLQVLSGLVGDPELARELLGIPPLALFYGWMALTFVPLLVTLTSGDAIAGEVASGSVRFALFRTERLAWCVGKLLGQTLLLGVGVLLGALGTFIVGTFAMGSFDEGPNLVWLLRLGLRAWAYGFAWLGLAMGASQLTGSVHWARGLALMLLVGAGVLNGVLDVPWITERVPVLADSLQQLLPGAHRLDLWRPALADRAPALVMLLALGAGYFAIGHQRFGRRDA